MLNNVLIISDLHMPFEYKGALQFCKQTYKKFKCNKVIFIGDLIDNSGTTRWDTNPDGLSPRDELTSTIKKLKSWYKTFPNAIVLIGNHERRVSKKLKGCSVTSAWLRSYAEVLGVPKWEFKYEHVLDGVIYLHGEGCSNTTQSILNLDSNIVFGHFHSKFELIYAAKKFGMCIGWLGDQEAYAFEYARTTTKKGMLGCGVVLNNGTLPILIPLK